MQYILNSAQMKQCDANTMERYGMLSAVLMERAALAAVDEIVKRFPDRESRVLIACGTGNNGGDGLAMGRLLHLKGYPVTILFPGNEEKCSVEAKRQLEIARNYKVCIQTEYVPAAYDIIVDALFGIGLCREIGGIYYTLIQGLNDMYGYKVAVDISSGISADHGAVMGVAFQADLTVTMGFAKAGQLLYPGADYTGELVVADIGIDQHSLFEIKPHMMCLEEKDLKTVLPKRKADSNKGTFGKVLVCAGSKDMAGAAYFSAKAAYRMGAGLVKIVTHESNRMVMHSLIPEAILATYTDDTDLNVWIPEHLSWADSVVLGPGIGTSALGEQLVHAVIHQVKVPCVVDADGLNILAKHMEWLQKSDAKLIVTPHLGEMSRLDKSSISEIKQNILDKAAEFSYNHQLITVLKDSRTVTCSRDGQIYINTKGNHGMATAGSGDVLTGIIGALLAMKVEPELAAPVAVMIHGMAGDASADRIGKASLMASDIIEGICQVIGDK